MADSTAHATQLEDRVQVGRSLRERRLACTKGVQGDCPPYRHLLFDAAGLIDACEIEMLI